MRRSSSRKSVYRAVELRCQGVGCRAVRRLAGKRLLLSEAPALPVAGCDAAVCRCEYIHFDDRRAGCDRRHNDVDRANSHKPVINEGAFLHYPRLAKVKLFVERHYREPLPLQTVAAVAGLERTYFSRFFHQKTGVCYRQWLAWIRVRNAVTLMTERDLPITRLAFRVGFRDLRTFERAFHEYTGMTPKAMQTRVRQELR